MIRSVGSAASDAGTALECLEHTAALLRVVVWMRESAVSIAYV